MSQPIRHSLPRVVRGRLSPSLHARVLETSFQCGRTLIFAYLRFFRDATTAAARASARPGFNGIVAFSCHRPEGHA